MACFSSSNIYQVFNYCHTPDNYSSLFCQFIVFLDTCPSLSPNTKHYVMINLCLSSLEKNMFVLPVTCNCTTSHENKLLMSLTGEETFLGGGVEQGGEKEILDGF